MGFKIGAYYVITESAGGIYGWENGEPKKCTSIDPHTEYPTFDETITVGRHRRHFREVPKSFKAGRAYKYVLRGKPDPNRRYWSSHMEKIQDGTPRVCIQGAGVQGNFEDILSSGIGLYDWGEDLRGFEEVSVYSPDHVHTLPSEWVSSKSETQYSQATSLEVVSPKEKKKLRQKKVLKNINPNF